MVDSQKVLQLVSKTKNSSSQYLIVLKAVQEHRNVIVDLYLKYNLST